MRMREKLPRYDYDYEYEYEYECEYEYEYEYGGDYSREEDNHTQQLCDPTAHVHSEDSSLLQPISFQRLFLYSMTKQTWIGLACGNDQSNEFCYELYFAIFNLILLHQLGSIYLDWLFFHITCK